MFTNVTLMFCRKVDRSRGDSHTLRERKPSTTSEICQTANVVAKDDLADGENLFIYRDDLVSINCCVATVMCCKI